MELTASCSGRFIPVPYWLGGLQTDLDAVERRIPAWNGTPDSQLLSVSVLAVVNKEDMFVVYLMTLFQYLRLYSVDFYSILIRLPSSSEAGETQVRNMAEFCRRALIVFVGFFYMP
jgi:hypothetical protein